MGRSDPEPWEITYTTFEKHFYPLLNHIVNERADGKEKVKLQLLALHDDIDQTLLEYVIWRFMGADGKSYKGNGYAPMRTLENEYQEYLSLAKQVHDRPPNHSTT